MGVVREVRARLTTTGYGRPITRCSSDASAAGSENAKTTCCAMPTRFQYKFRERRDDGTQTKHNVRGLRGTHGRIAPAEEGNVWGDARG